MDAFFKICCCFSSVFILFVNPNSLDNKGSCWILLDCYCSVTMLRDLGLIAAWKTGIWAKTYLHWLYYYRQSSLMIDFSNHLTEIIILQCVTTFDKRGTSLRLWQIQLSWPDWWSTGQLILLLPMSSIQSRSNILAPSYKLWIHALDKLFKQSSKTIYLKERSYQIMWYKLFALSNFALIRWAWLLVHIILINSSSIQTKSNQIWGLSRDLSSNISSLSWNVLTHCMLLLHTY